MKYKVINCMKKSFHNISWRYLQRFEGHGCPKNSVWLSGSELTVNQSKYCT